MNGADFLGAMRRAYPDEALRAAGVELARAQLGPNGGISWTLRSIDWGTVRRIDFTALLVVSCRGSEIRDLIERAVLELREPPPFWVDP